METSRTVTIRISGRVQGVGYRAWTCSEANALGLRGWVRNEADGAVTALLSGKADRVAEMLDRLRQGPPGAAVSAVTAEDSDDRQAPAGFEIRY